MPGDGTPRLVVEVRVPSAGSGRPRLDVRLALGAGITSVTGPSGAGKSTLLLTVAGLVKPALGRVSLDGVELFSSQRKTFVPAHRRRVALVFQSLALFPHLSAWQNVAYGLPATPRAARREKALEWMTRAHVAHVAERSPSTLSGGEAQRVALARALASEPRALLFDEPFSALDDPLRRELGAEVKALVETLGIPALLVTHHREDAATLGSGLVELAGGLVVSDRSMGATG